jgi:hypothetical protein
MDLNTQAPEMMALAFAPPAPAQHITSEQDFMVTDFFLKK